MEESKFSNAGSGIFEKLKRQEKIVKEYYAFLDRGELDKALSIFDDSIVYQRGENPIINCKSNMRDFYQSQRKIKKGVHKNLKCFSTNKEVGVTGNFVGELKDGSKVNVIFKDVFIFGVNGKVVSRKTSFPGNIEI